MLVNISTFAKERGEQSQTVAKWIREHGFPLIEKGKQRLIDTDAEWFKELDEKYPLPKPVIIVNGVPEEEHREVLERLTKAQDAIIVLQKQLSDQLLLNAENEAKTMLLEDKQKRLEEDKQKSQEETERLKAELEAEKTKTWWQKLRGK